MIDRQQLLADLKPIVKAMEADLRARCDEVDEINAGLKKEYDQARAADRTGVAFEEWRADLITQFAVAWVLSCVFVRFLEDNALISPPRISGPLHDHGSGGLQRARDERETYFRSHPRETDRDYLLAVFDDLAKLPGTKDVFGPHNLALSAAYRNWPSGDAAQKLIEFFQKIDADATGEIVHNFTDPVWDTRFLGDLYQDLSEAARKKYALLQTPIFVEEFILERTLEPAVAEFAPKGQGLEHFRMIDPACGSGHFLLGSFARILKHWRAKEPGTSDRELVNRSLASVHGVDLNPYAVAIARFRLLIAAMRECHITRLQDAPAFAFNLACGDSLLHGAPGASQQVLGFHELAHHYQSEEIDELCRLLSPGKYHVVVANPPYITVSDPILSAAYRERYASCFRAYSLSVPFMERIFHLAIAEHEGQSGAAGYTGQITSNAFMRREFGKKIIEELIPKWDLTHVIDTAGAYIPGHGTPTVIIFGRNRRPVSPHVRAAMGTQGEPSTPTDPAQGLVWTAIVENIDTPGAENAYVTIADVDRVLFGRHPWSLGGGGAAALKARLDAAADTTVGDLADAVGRSTHVGEDDAYFLPPSAARRIRCGDFLVPVVRGEDVRDYIITPPLAAVFPYCKETATLLRQLSHPLMAHFWTYRTSLRNRVDYGQTVEERGLRWFDHTMFFPERYLNHRGIAHPNVATHNHFAAIRESMLFNSTAPVIYLRHDTTSEEMQALLLLLNSSLACFWIKQVFHNKGSTVDDAGARQRTSPFEDFYQSTSAAIKKFPVKRGPAEGSADPSRLAAGAYESSPRALGIGELVDAVRKDERHRTWHRLRRLMIAAQEEVDWQTYRRYELTDGDLSYSGELPEVELGQRPFEIALARSVQAGDEETTYFVRHGSTPITDIPQEWPKEYRELVQRRLDTIASNKSISLVERPEYKRRWNLTSWQEQEVQVVGEWLLERLESYADLDGRMNDQKEATARGDLREPHLTSVAKMADLARADRDFMQVAEIFTGRMDFDVGALVGDLVAAESVPALPVLRYKPAALDKRAAWERTWELQRLEDAIDALFDIERLKKIDAAKAEAAMAPLVAALRIDEEAKPQVLREVIGAASYVAEASKQKLNLASDTILSPVHDAAKRAKKVAVGDIPVPSKYTSADFLTSGCWRLRGKLDVPKERWVSFPYCEGEDGTLVIAWAGYDHLQLARSIAERYELAKEQEGRKLVPLLAAIGQLIPWLKQWHNDLDPAYGTRMGDYFENYLTEEAKALGTTVEQVMAWTPPEKPKGRGRKKKA